MKLRSTPMKLVAYETLGSLYETYVKKKRLNHQPSARCVSHTHMQFVLYKKKALQIVGPPIFENQEKTRIYTETVGKKKKKKTPQIVGPPLRLEFF